MLRDTAYENGERVVQLATACVSPNCGGTMHFTGNALTSIPMLYQHRCNKCGRMENYARNLTPMMKLQRASEGDSTFLLGLADGARRSGRKDVAERLTEIAGKL